VPLLPRLNSHQERLPHTVSLSMALSFPCQRLRKGGGDAVPYDGRECGMERLDADRESVLVHTRRVSVRVRHRPLFISSGLLFYRAGD
jgi:hypothetical protein